MNVASILFLALVAIIVFSNNTAVAQGGPSSPSIPTIAPVRPEFTRPGGMPGAARGAATADEQYLRAVPSEPVAKKKKSKRAK